MRKIHSEYELFQYVEDNAKRTKNGQTLSALRMHKQGYRAGRATAGELIERLN